MKNRLLHAFVVNLTSGGLWPDVTAAPIQIVKRMVIQFDGFTSAAVKEQAACKNEASLNNICDVYDVDTLWTFYFCVKTEFHPITKA